MPNTEVKLVNAESTWLEAIWEDRKLLNKISISYEVLFLLCISSQIASGLACYVRKYKLNFRNRELLDKRQHFPTGAESTCLEGRTAGGKSPCGSTFSDHPMDNLTSQLHLLNIEILQILRPLRSAAHEDNSLSSCLFFQAASGLVCESWLTEACKTFPVLERKGDQPAAGGK